MDTDYWCVEQIWIKDVKSSNGTFINGDRLSAEAAESDPFELHTDDVVVRLVLHFSMILASYWVFELKNIGIWYWYR